MSLLIWVRVNEQRSFLQLLSKCLGMWPPQKLVWGCGPHKSHALFIHLSVPALTLASSGPNAPCWPTPLGIFQRASEISTCDWSIERPGCEKTWRAVVAPYTLNIPVDILILFFAKLAAAWARFCLLEESFSGSSPGCNSCCISKAKLNHLTLTYTEMSHFLPSK